MLQKRCDVPEERRWRLEDLYPDDAAWEKDFALLGELIEGLPACKGRLGEGAGALKEALESLYRARLLADRLYSYAHMRRDEDNGSVLYQGLTDRAAARAVALDDASSHYTPELLACGEEYLRAMLAEPSLGVYEPYLRDTLRAAPHTLSPAEESLLAKAGEVLRGPDTIYTMLGHADMRFPEILDGEGERVQLTRGNFIPLMESEDRALRQNAYEAMYGEYKKLKSTVAAAYAANVKGDNFLAAARRYPSAAEAALHQNDIPLSVLESLIRAVDESLPVFHRYMALRKKRLRLDGPIRFFDIYVPLGGEFTQKFPFGQAAFIVQEGLSALGPEYGAALASAFDGGWIDVEENEGKTGGAYSWGAWGTHPFVLLNYRDTLDNVFTLAHELGHAMHSFYADQQPYPKAQYPIFLAEVASTCNENLLLHALLKKLDDRDSRVKLLLYNLEQIRTTVYRQTMFAEFEWEAHKMDQKGEPLTVESLNALYRRLLIKHFGPDVLVDDTIPYEWMRIPHFYNSFYVYQYATGFSAAIALAEQVLSEGPERYLRFLSSGGSRPPLETLREAGVDMEKPDAVRACLHAFERTLGELEGLLGEG